MRSPPVRSYIHIALPSARASFAVDQAVAGEDRDQERQHAHEVRRVAQRDLALGERFVDEARPRAAAGSGCPPCTSFDDFDDVPDAKSSRSTSAVRRPAAGGVERDAGAGDAAADDEHVELLVAEAAERVGALEQRGRGSHCAQVTAR